MLPFLHDFGIFNKKYFTQEILLEDAPLWTLPEDIERSINNQATAHSPNHLSSCPAYMCTQKAPDTVGHEETGARWGGDIPMNA